jgi:hypothetical protein
MGLPEFLATSVQQRRRGTLAVWLTHMGSIIVTKCCWPLHPVTDRPVLPSQAVDRLGLRKAGRPNDIYD